MIYLVPIDEQAVRAWSMDARIDVRHPGVKVIRERRDLQGIRLDRFDVVVDLAGPYSVVAELQGRRVKP